MTDLSPLDILGKTFKKRLNGYDPQQVHEFLSEVGGVFEQLVRERGELRQQVAKMEIDLAEFRRRESALQQALVAAQRSAEETVEGARRKADDELEKARAEGQRTLEEAQALAQRIMDETNQRIRTLEGVGRLHKAPRPIECNPPAVGIPEGIRRPGEITHLESVEGLLLVVLEERGLGGRGREAEEDRKTG